MMNNERACSGTLTPSIWDKIGTKCVQKKILDHLPEFLGFQNVANLSRGVPTPISEFFNHQKSKKSRVLVGGSRAVTIGGLGGPMGAPWGPMGAPRGLLGVPPIFLPYSPSWGPIAAGWPVGPVTLVEDM